MKILITGGAGFIGNTLIRNLLLSTEHEIINLDKLGYASDLTSFNLLDEKSLSRYKFLKVDLIDFLKLKEAIISSNPDRIINLAAESHVDRSIINPNLFLKSNVIGTFNLLEVVRDFYNNLSKTRQENFILHHISTDEVFGSLGANGKFSEQTSYDPRSPYSASKAASDHFVRAWFHTYKIPTIVSSCSNNYGPWQFPEKLIPTIIINALNNNQIPIYGNGLNIRDWLYVDDHVEAIKKICFAGEPGQTYCIGGGAEKTNLEVAFFICETLDLLFPLAFSYKTLIKFVEDRPGHDKRYAIDSSNIKNKLNWQPKYKFEDGIRNTILWYKDNLNWCKNLVLDKK
jgi:dTDP-glucose 4,6-dehydratase